MEDFIGEISDAILVRPTSYSKLKLAIESLSSEEWFRQFFQSFKVRYVYLV